MRFFDWLKNPFGGKESAVSGAISKVYSVGQPVWTPVNFESIAKQGFKSSVYVFRSIELISKGAAGIPWLLYEARGGRTAKEFGQSIAHMPAPEKRKAIKAAIERKELVEIESSPLLDLMRRPNPRQGGGRFVESWVAFYLIAGNTYLEAVGPDRGAPRELYVLRPDRMKIIVGNSANPIAGYEYTAAMGKVVFPFERVLHVMTFDPLSDWYGMPPLEAAFKSVDQNNAAKAWNVAMLQNAAMPSGALTTKNALTDAQFDRLNEQIKQQFSGYKNAGKPLLLENEMDWRQMSVSPVDMAWLDGQKLSAREIGLAFGVPSQLIGDNESSTYSNYQEARKALYQETILPLMDSFRGELNNWLTPKFGDRLFLDYDADSIEALQEDRDKTYNRVGKGYVDGWLKLNETRRAAGFEEVEGGDVFKWQIEAAMAATKVQPTQGKARAFATVDSDSCCDADAKAEVIEAAVEIVGFLPAPIAQIGRKASGLGSEEAKALFWKAFEDEREPFYSSVEKEMIKRFESEAEAVAKAVGKLKDPAKAEAAIAKALDGQAGEWFKLTAAIYMAVGKHFGDRQIAELTPKIKKPKTKAADSIDWLQVVMAFVEEHGGDRIEDITETTRAALGSVLSTGIAQGLSIPQIAALIRETYSGFAGRRAVVIARTEVINASNAGSWASAMSVGVPLVKEWIATRDQRVRGRRARDRYSHIGMDGQRVAADAPFIEPRTGEELMWPGDYSRGAQAGNVIQCRCTQFFEVAEENDE